MLPRSTPPEVLNSIVYLQVNLELVSALFEIQHISLPANLTQIKSRLKLNLHRFSDNYTAVFVTLALCSLLTNWKLMSNVILLAVSAFLIEKLDAYPLGICHHQFPLSQRLILSCAAALLIILRSSILVTVASIGGSGVLAVSAHALLVNNPVEEEKEKRQVGLRSRSLCLAIYSLNYVFSLELQCYRVLFR